MSEIQAPPSRLYEVHLSSEVAGVVLRILFTEQRLEGQRIVVSYPISTPPMHYQSAARNPPAFEQEVHYLHSAVACGLAPGIVELVRARLRHHRFSNHWINHVSDHLQGAVDLVEVQVYERFTSFNEQPAEEDSTDLDRLPQPVCLRVVACGGRLVISGYGYKKYQAYTQDKAVTVGSAYVACDLTIDPAINFSRTSRCESEREVRLLVLATFEKACFTPDHQEVIGPEIVRDICQHNYV